MTATNLRHVQTVPQFEHSTSSSLLLRNLIDYAGLFPPASLDMPAAVANYEEYSRSRWNWMLGRFIVPVARLGEFEAAFNQLPNDSSVAQSRRWPLSLLLTSDVSTGVSRILNFNADMESRSTPRSAKVEAVEIKVAHEAEIQREAKAIPDELEAYFEIPPADESCFAALASTRRRAKIRTGGETSEKFPTSEDIVAFMQRAVAAGVPFKATAGLHHPLRSVRRYTYQADSPSGVMHGFLNVFLAAVFLRFGLNAELATELLKERSADAIQFDPDGVVWRGHHLRNDEISAARTEFAISFGSCSFTEPIEDLRALKLL